MAVTITARSSRSRTILPSIRSRISINSNNSSSSSQRRSSPRSHIPPNDIDGELL